MENHRYAIYYAPPKGGALAAFGASWLGRDAESGRDIPPEGPEGWISTPRKYGFHGTLKPPFRLAEGMTEAGLREALKGLAASKAPLRCAPLRLARLGRFLALVPSKPSDDLRELAACCVMGMDKFRAPLTDADIERRRSAGLTPRQDELMLEWGYPYVLEEFRFHLTLTGALGDDEIRKAEALLAPLVAPFCEGDFEIGELTLFIEEGASGFRIIDRFPLAG